ncbi:hypothetical protein RCC89_13565 [Cytophagaceae bacterium ABcell3]|nr:hypothetical protein RCC89_13565 [Cytophagaceae bacterium ABcell3]
MMKLAKLCTILIFNSLTSLGQVNSEILIPLECSINEKVPVVGHVAVMKKALGEPLSTEIVDYECGMTEEQEGADYQSYYLYGETKFFIYDEKYKLKIIDFKSGDFIFKTPKITLTGATTFDDLEKVFPRAVKASLKENNGRLVRLQPCKYCDGEVQLYIENGKLVKLQLWESC